MERLVYEIYRGVLLVLRALPLGVVIAVARAVGVFAWWVMVPYRRLVLRNLEIAFGGEWSDQKRWEVGLENFARLGANLAAGFWWGQRDVRELLAHVDIDGLEHFERISRSGRGAVVILSHVGNWELAARLIPALFPGPMGSVYQRLGNRWMDAAVRREREREGLKLFERKQGFHGAIELVRSGGIVGVLADQHAGDAGYWCPLFGRLASTTTLPALMAMRSGGAVLSCAVYSRPKGRWKLVLGAELDLPGRDSAEWTARINREVERQIREQPQDWLWAHNRWKTPKPDFLLGTVRRGVAATGFSHRFRLVVRSPNWLGDAVMSVPAVRALKKGRPDLELTVLVPEKLADLWREVAEVDRVVSIPAGVGIVKTAELLRKWSFDAALLLPNSLRVALEAWWAGVPRLVGVPGHARAFLLHQVVRLRSADENGPRHQVHHYLDLVRAIGAPVSAEESPEMREILLARKSDRETSPWPGGIERGTGLEIAVCPGAEYGPAKRWFPDRFAAVMAEVSTRWECRWHLVGVARDVAVGQSVLRALPGEGSVKIEDWVGRTSLRELIELLKRCDLLLTNDTGTMHLAALLGVPVVAVFGSTEPRLTGPLGDGHAVVQHRVPCGPCFLRECPLDSACMDRVRSGEVVEAVEKVALQRGKEKKVLPRRKSDLV